MAAKVDSYIKQDKRRPNARRGRPLVEPLYRAAEFEYRLDGFGSVVQVRRPAA